MTNSELITIISNLLDVPESDMKSQSRKSHIVEARHLAMYFIKCLNNTTMVNIGKLLNRDHTTVSYAIERVFNTANKHNPKFNKKFILINNEIGEK